MLISSYLTAKPSFKRTVFSHLDAMRLSVATANANWSGIRLLVRVAGKIVYEIKFCLTGE